MRSALLLLIVLKLTSAEIPDWVIRGIAKVETNSTWRDLGDIDYGNKEDGIDGEVGFMQLSPIALRQLKKYHLRNRVRRDVVLCESLAREYLLWLYRRAGSWRRAVAMYNVGPDGDKDVGEAYYHNVRKAGM